MAKLVISLDGVVIKEVQITKDKTTLVGPLTTSSSTTWR